jgi:hypothetical protein
MTGNALEHAAFMEARRLGHHWIGPEHGMLAILHAADPDDVAYRVLTEARIDADRFEQNFLATRGKHQRVGDDKEGTITPTPAWYRFFGRAEGFAAAMGSVEVLPVHLLLALLWDEQDRLLSERHGVVRETLVESLLRLGVRVPTPPLPALPAFGSSEAWQRVDLPSSALDRVMPLLIQRYPPGSGPRFRFNHDGHGNAWVYAQEGIDLQALLTEALGNDPQ